MEEDFKIEIPGLLITINLMSFNSDLLYKWLGFVAVAGIVSLLPGFEEVNGFMDVKLTTAKHIAGPLSYSCPSGLTTNALSFNFTGSRIADNTGGRWDIMAGGGPYFKNGTIQNITISKNNYYILGQEIADNICKDPVPLTILIYGKCNANGTINYSQSNAEKKMSFGLPSALNTHCLFGPLISHNPSLLYNCPRNILNCLDYESHNQLSNRSVIDFFPSTGNVTTERAHT